jgi:hypothetical protein
MMPAPGPKPAPVPKPAPGPAPSKGAVESIEEPAPAAEPSSGGYDVPAPIEAADEEVIEEAVEEVGATDEAPAEEEASTGGDYQATDEYESGYRRKVSVDWSKIRVEDINLQFNRFCRDMHSNCNFWAGYKAGDRNPKTGTVFQRDLCQENAFLLTEAGCPKACNVCTNNRAEWNLRRRLAKAKLSLLKRRNAV